MNTTAEIYLWGTRVGIIHQDLDKTYASLNMMKIFKKWNRNITNNDAS